MKMRTSIVTSTDMIIKSEEYTIYIEHFLVYSDVIIWYAERLTLLGDAECEVCLVRGTRRVDC